LHLLGADKGVHPRGGIRIEEEEDGGKEKEREVEDGAVVLAGRHAFGAGCLLVDEGWACWRCRRTRATRTTTTTTTVLHAA
jgi:hypothetical protein